MQGPDGTHNELFFKMTAAGCLTQRVDEFFTFRSSEEAGLTPDDFHEYGRIIDGHFTPYWHDNETFDAFTQREAGLNQSPDLVVEEAVNDFFIKDQVPITPESLEVMDHLTNLFSAAEVDALRAQAILVESEYLQSLALLFQSIGTIPPGTVSTIESPLVKLHENADPEIAEFYEEVRKAAGGVYGVPKYFPNPEIDLTIVDEYRSQNVIYSEPQLKLLSNQEEPVWSATVQGEAREAKNNIPIFSLEEEVYLVVMNLEKNQQLTASLLKKRHLLRYWIGAKIIDLQRKKMDNLKYTFRKVSARKEIETKNGTWPFSEPAKKEVNTTATPSAESNLPVPTK